MKVKADKEFVSLIKKVKGTNLNEIVLVFDKLGMRIKQLDELEHRLVDMMVRKEAPLFFEYEVDQLYEFPIPDLELFIQFLSSFETLFNIESQERSLVLSAETENLKRRFEYLLAEKKFIVKYDVTQTKDTAGLIKKYQFLEKISVKFLDRVLRDASIVSSERIGLTKDKNNLIFSVGEKGGYRIEETYKIKKNIDLDLNLGLNVDYFREIVSGFTEKDVVIGLGQDLPILFKEEGEKWIIYNFVESVR